MKVSEALEKVGRAYVPGVAAYYERFNPDPWQQSHDELESVMQAQNPELNETAAQQFVDRCIGLIERFKRESDPRDSVSNKDALHMMSVKSVKAWQSRRHKHCVKCQSESDLRIKSVEGTVDVVLVCKQCLDRGAA